ncbi:fatty acid desaturase [Aliiglaciecola sp. SL4]|uniref:fatty acid desaturase family protein n=1 Tax=Aliiglaciecola sp. SL4 TaxID=3239806 RepID=UPI00355C1140
MLKLSDHISSDELKALCQSSDLVGWYRVLVNYALISAAGIILLIFPYWYTFICCSWIVGGRILGIAVLNHDAGHGTLFRSHRLNHIVGRWLLGSLVLVDYHAFKTGHGLHHRYAGSKQDPDKLFVIGYPATPSSMVRKFARDFSGINGFKEIAYQISVSSWQKRLPNIVVHSVIIVSLLFFNALWIYSVFWAGYIFIYPALSRIRIMGEHGAVTNINALDPRLNTRTTLTNPFVSLLICPNNVNYHLEHHIHQKIPAQNLKKAHVLFKQRGMYEGFDCIESNYWQVLKKCISKRHGISNLTHHAPSSVNNMS